MLHRRLTDDVKVTESDIVRRIKNERVNRGSKNYRAYLEEAYGKGRALQMLRARSQKS